MTPTLFFQIWLGMTLSLHPVEEIWNYNNPRPFPKKEYILINWDQGDFKKVDNEWVLMTKHRWDKPFKANARKRYYEQNR